MTIKSITVTLLAPMSDHAANRGEKLLGNASSIKRRPDGRVYISGQMQRHALFSAIDRLNADDPQKGDTFVANGDAPTTEVHKDLRSDLGGYLDPNKGDYSGRRTAPLTATPAVAVQPSEVGRDLLVRLKPDASRVTKTGKVDDKPQALATNEYSQRDLMRMSFHIDVGAVSRTKHFAYNDETHVKTTIADHGIDGAERQRRVRLAVEATRSLTDYANQARNATSGEPEQVLIVLDPKMSRKAVRYFEPRETEGEQAAVRANLLRELEARDALVFHGDDTSAEGPSVHDAYQAALAALDTHTLYDPA